jgi:alpha-tubulin suppressor-like RCC1 family protein
MQVFSKELLMAIKENGIAQIVIDSYIAWIVLGNGDLYGCGWGRYGNQGDGSSGSSNNVLTFTKRASNVAKVKANYYTTWYLTKDGDLYGCGAGSLGQQGNGDTSNVTTFTKRASNVLDFDASGETTWYINSNGDLYGSS